jgi:hypothetical protein
MGNTVFNATVTFDHEPTILIGATASQNPPLSALQNSATLEKV